MVPLKKELLLPYPLAINNGAAPLPISLVLVLVPSNNPSTYILREVPSEVPTT